MCLFRKRIVVSQLTQEQINSLLIYNKYFDGLVRNGNFEIRESMLSSNRVLFPIIKGTIEKYYDSTNVVISFNVSKQDKLGLGIFLFISFLISVLFGIVSSDVLLTIIIICFSIVSFVIFLIYYISNCQRAYKKILFLFESKISN